jgi:hypothetical protein
MDRVSRPQLAVMADKADSLRMEGLFARCGFAVVQTPSLAALRSFCARDGQAPLVTILDFVHPDARAALRAVDDIDPPPARVGILAGCEVAAYRHALDAVFVRPVDQVRLVGCVVDLVAARNEGNSLFDAVKHELARVVPEVSAGAMLAGLLRSELSVHPLRLQRDHLRGLLGSGSLATALLGRARSTGAAAALIRIEALAEGGPERALPPYPSATRPRALP